ncbi:dienelactone hydrolase family protein [Litoreibacter meonggei]|uniref:Dienelactone hydrolase family protein n=1 Tax=Litoreibacter meonggei TaxID=1049199 RepID=A0A497WT29_9RHOB|nr:dienelactone hydrolase family protein [Litoreibacter meonggei]RLJ59968.1 dienelactone hydrolase family protein [Litoreibacter meonggei]
MNVFLAALTIAVLIFSPFGVSAQSSVLIGNVPLPQDAVVPQDAESPFLGAWGGKWDNWRNHILIVERVKANGVADVIYAASSEHNGRGNWLRLEAKINGDELVFTDERFPVRYSISATGRMRGVYGDNERFAILKRQDIPAMLSSPNEDWFSVGDLERLETDLVEDKQKIGLSVVIYSPSGDGPFPLALIHHGSTGTGKQPTWFKNIWTNDWLADILNENGWIAAFPQRRGRGGSDGLYDEGFATDRSQGYSSDAAISIAGAERALEDANAALAALKQLPMVQSGETLLGGVSRGGVVAIMQAGQSPDEAAGVINFVGGWVSEGCCDAPINRPLFRRIGLFDGPVLSIYGEEDAFYSIDHSRSNLAEMEMEGANSELLIVEVPGYGKGHWVTTQPNLWEEVIGEYLNSIDR